MKYLILNIFLIYCSFFINAQENNKQCDKYQSDFIGFIADNNFDEAQKLYPFIFKKCDLASEKFYLNAEKLQLHNLEFSKNNDEKLLNIQNLISVYDFYDKKFPANTNGNASKKAIYLYDNNIGSKTEVLNILDNLFKTKPKDFKDARAFYIYFEIFEKASKEPQSKIEIGDLISKNIEINDKNNELQKTLTSEIETLNSKQKSVILTTQENTELIAKNADLQAYKTIENASVGLLQKYLTCDNLKNYVSKNLETNKNNDFWLKFVTKQMFDKSCYANDVFLQTATQSNAVNATSKTNYYLGFANLLKSDPKKTIDYFEESANKESNIQEKAKIYYTIATSVFGINDKLNASLYLKKVVETDSKFGKPYLYLSQLYLSSINECAKTEFEKKAMYWLIASTVEKAGIAEEYLKNSSEKLKNDYLKKAPTQSEISKSGQTGKSIKFDCFINQTIEVPKK